jgi:hypothetical protein
MAEPFVKIRAMADSAIGVVVTEEPCRVLTGNRAIETECRVVFRVDEFPSAEIEIVDLDLDTSTDLIVSIEFPQSGFSLRDVQLGRNPRTCRIGGYSHHFRIRHTEPMQLCGALPVATANAFLYRLVRRIRG